MPAKHSETIFHLPYIKITEMIHIWWSPRSVLPPISLMIRDYVYTGKWGSNTEVIAVLLEGWTSKLPHKQILTHGIKKQNKTTLSKSLICLSALFLFPCLQLSFFFSYLRAVRGWSLLVVGSVLWPLSDCTAAIIIFISKPAKRAWKWKGVKSSVLC